MYLRLLRDLNRTRLECKAHNHVHLTFLQVHLNRTRLECKAVMKSRRYYRIMYLNRTRLECKAQILVTESRYCKI